MARRLRGSSDSPKKLYSPTGSLIVFFLIMSALVFNVVQIHNPSIKLGLDLRGGTSIVLSPVTAGDEKIDAKSIEVALNVLRKRVDGFGVAESSIHAEGSGKSTKIVVAVPGVTSRALVALVGQTAKLTIRPVLWQAGLTSSYVPVSADRAITAQVIKTFNQLRCKATDPKQVDTITQPLVACDSGGQTKYLLGATQVDGSQVKGAQANFDNGGLGWTTDITFNSAGQDSFGALTTNVAAQKPPRNNVAIVLDGKVITAPRVEGPLTGGNVRIFGGFTQEYAVNLANILKYGSLPFSFQIDQVIQISPSLGAAQLNSGLFSGFLGLLLVVLFLLFYYRGLGVLAVGSLVVAFLITLGLFILLGNWIGLTLSLAGIAGAIVSIGVTADSFIVFFERIRDEMRKGKSLRSAIESGWLRARRTIVVADSVSLIAAVVLYLSAVGDVRGFAFTLGLTTLIDLFIVYFFTRPTLFLFSKVPFFANGANLSGLSQVSLGILQTEHHESKGFRLRGLGSRLNRGDTSLNILQSPKRWLFISGFLVVLSIGGLLLQGLNLGIEFKGGSINSFKAPNVSVAQAQKVLTDIGYHGESIILKTGKDEIVIQTKSLTNADSLKLVAAVDKNFHIPANAVNSETIGPSWGAEITHKALVGLIWFLLLLTIYMAFISEIRMAYAAIIAVIHDIVITVGLYALIGLTVTPSAVIGFLTILGYSLYDSVVVFDKVRENTLKLSPNTLDEYRKRVNKALDQTIVRSVNTSFVAIIPVASILFIGSIVLKAQTLQDISLALVIGQTIGAYSSIFVATPVLVALNSNRFKKVKSVIDLSGGKSALVERATSKNQSIFMDSEQYIFQNLDNEFIGKTYEALQNSKDGWEFCWVKEPIPSTLAALNDLVQNEKYRSGVQAFPYYVAINKDQERVFSLMTVTRDEINMNITLKVLFIDSSAQTNGVSELLQLIANHLRGLGFERIIFEIPSHSGEPELLANSSVMYEGFIQSAFKSRSTGRCGANVYSAISHAD
jgi:protein-export membrane protein SecD/preprotein translocase SecF subunit